MQGILLAVYIGVFLIIYSVFYFQFIERGMLIIASQILGHKVRRRWHVLETLPVITTSHTYINDKTDEEQKTPNQVKTILFILNIILLIIAVIIGIICIFFIVSAVNSVFYPPEQVTVPLTTPDA